jgi:hypothetical protein
VRVLNRNTTICSFRISLANIHRLILAGLVALVFSGLAARGASAQASDVYITPDGGGNGVCTNNVHPPSWFNNSANWGSGSSQIGAGTIVHLCGTFTNAFTAQGNGSSGNPVTILWESGAKLSAPAFLGAWFILDGCSNIVLDGGTDGVIEDTANGTNLGNHIQSDAIRADNATNIEVKNLHIQNLYVHQGLSDTMMAVGSLNCFLANHPSGTFSIHDNVMHDMNWCLKIGQYTNPGVTLNIYDNEIFNIDHGMAIFGDTTDQPYTLNFHDNWVHDFANWDTSVNLYHHDGIHIYAGDGVRTFYNNKFSGSMGVNNTSYVFEEIMQGGSKGSNPGGSQVWYNNVWIQAPNNNVSNALAYITGNAAFYNNTFVCNDTNGGDNQGGLRYNFGTLYYNSIPRHLTFENNAMSGCVTFFEGINTIFDSLNYNVYVAATSGGQHKWSYNTTSLDAIAAWQSTTGKDGSSLYNPTSGLNSLGMPQSGSPVLSVGVNLSTLGITPLNSDTSAGHTKTPFARSSSWNAGAFGSGSSAAATPPTPPAGLTAIVQ